MGRELSEISGLVPASTTSMWAVRAGDHRVPLPAIATGIIRTAKTKLPEELQ